VNRYNRADPKNAFLTLPGPPGAIEYYDQLSIDWPYSISTAMGFGIHFPQLTEYLQGRYWQNEKDAIGKMK
jgi:hypothetical protein